jgi:hypothetical protein
VRDVLPGAIRDRVGVDVVHGVEVAGAHDCQARHACEADDEVGLRRVEKGFGLVGMLEPEGQKTSRVSAAACDRCVRIARLQVMGGRCEVRPEELRRPGIVGPQFAQPVAQAQHDDVDAGA